MDATKPNIPNPDEIERKLNEAAYRSDDGIPYVRASVAAKIIGISPGLQTRWIKDGRIKPMRFRVPRGTRAPRGILTAWPLGQAVCCGRKYWTNSCRRWTDAEDVYLADQLGKKSLAAIGNDLGRTQKSVRMRATDMGITQRNAHGDLTTGEIAQLCEVSREAVQYWIFKKPRPLVFRRSPARDRVKLVSAENLRDFFMHNPTTFKRLSIKAQQRVERYTMPLHHRRKLVAA